MALTPPKACRPAFVLSAISWGGPPVIFLENPVDPLMVGPPVSFVLFGRFELGDC
jgi:hypothetical protein